MASADASSIPLDLASLARAHADGTSSPAETVRLVRARIDERGSDGVWISVVSEQALLEAARLVESRRAAGEILPLYGVPFAVKDNIDVAGLATTAACPAFAYTPDISARSVTRLVAAGGIVIGKTNMDQFASGLVGVRSPYGIPRNPFSSDHVTGGSSSGSAVAVAVGEVSFALGTDTAGSGRIPAAFNNIVGLKPSRGVISTTGVVPACRSLDCVSVFAGSCEDAAAVADVMRGFDPADPFSRAEADGVRFAPETHARAFRFGIPKPNERDFCGDTFSAEAFDTAVSVCTRMGGTAVEIDLGPFREAGAMLYGGPCVSERLEAAGQLFALRPDTLLAPLRSVLEDATRYTASAAWMARTRLRLLRRRIATAWQAVDFLLLPTAPTLPRVDAVEGDPLRVNASLGMYATFVNLLDLAAWAVPSGFRRDGLPAGVTVVGPWGSDARLGGFATRIHRETSPHMGATTWPIPSPGHVSAADAALPAFGQDAQAIPLAVVGAHLTGEPLNHELTSAGGKLLAACQTKPRYRLFALPGTNPPKPGLVRTSDGKGAAIDIEVWALPPAAFGAFVSRIAAPLCIGKIEIEDGRLVSGFLCEGHATIGARDISGFGGWRAYRRSGS